jgi:hypothetical protein
MGLCLICVVWRCLRYNSEVRLSTLRWAVLALLRKPPPGLEDVIKAHFRWDGVDSFSSGL